MAKVALITGASRGIGRAIALRLAKDGYTVALNYHQNEKAAVRAAEVLTAFGKEGMLCRADVTREHAVHEMVREVERRLGPIDLLVNNAGIAEQVLFTDLTAAQWKKMMDVHVNGAFYTSQAVLPSMIRRKSGKILNLSSIWGQKGASCEVGYSASKAAIIGLTKALAKEVGLSGITVNCVAPGVIDTDMNGHLDPQTMASLKEETPLARIGTPEEVAQLLYFLASDKAAFITGQVIGINGGFGE